MAVWGAKYKKKTLMMHGAIFEIRTIICGCRFFRSIRKMFQSSRTHLNMRTMVKNVEKKLSIKYNRPLRTNQRA